MLNVRSGDRTIISDPSHHPSTVFLTPDRKIHALEETFREHGSYMEFLTWHLLKYREILDVAAEKLPRLKIIETQLHTRSWDKDLRTRVKATVKDGALWTDWNNVELKYQHDWIDRDGASSDFSDQEDDVENLYHEAPYLPAEELSNAD